jgi:hypothetical protein
MAYTDIDRPQDYFVTTTWSGNDVDGRTISNGEFKPDFLWMFHRNIASCPGVVYNSTIGAGTDSSSFGGNANGKYNAVFTSLNYELADGDFYRYGYLSGLTSTGFTCAAGNDPSGYQNYRHNQTGYNYVAWQWKANGGTTTSKSSITHSSTNVTTPCIQQVNTTSGISILTYTASSSYAGSETHLEHGLGVGPKVVIVKSLDAYGNWAVYHAENGGSPNAGYSYNLLNTTAATAQSSPTNKYWLNTPKESDSELIALGSGDDTGADGKNYVAYCFAEKQGYSKFGKYVGNLSVNGPFVYTGFKPAWIMIKRAAGGTSSYSSWAIHDNKRLSFNSATGGDKVLWANGNYVEGTRGQGGSNNGETARLDILSNGFKIRDGGSDEMNDPSDTYIYMAFAENPFVTSTGVPTTAR